MNIDMITRLTGRIPLEESDKPLRSCVQLSVRGTPVDITELKRSFLEMSGEHQVDIAFQEDNIYRRNRRFNLFRYGFDTYSN